MQLVRVGVSRYICGMEFFKTPKLSASITPDGLVLRHINGATVTVPLARLERWLMKLLRSEL